MLSRSIAEIQAGPQLHAIRRHGAGSEASVADYALVTMDGLDPDAMPIVNDYANATIQVATKTPTDKEGVLRML
jgi:hypothetical protein